MALLFYILFSLMIFIAFAFSLLLLVSVYRYKQKDRIPVVYIYQMTACSIGVCFVELQSDIVPFFLKKKTYMWIYRNLGESFTLFDNFIYAYPMFLTILMISERIYCIIYPFGRAFTSKKLWLYCLGLAMFLLILFFIPFFGGCADNYSFYDFDYTSECDPDDHPITLMFDEYARYLPVICLFLNFGVIYHISKRRKRFRNTTTREPNVRQTHEKTLLIQAISSTIFLLIYEIGYVATEQFSDFFDSLPKFTQRVIYYLQAGLVAYTSFFVYFVCTSSVRKIVIDNVYGIFKIKRIQPVTPSTTLF
ncbi:Serpentine Receptor, class XA [Caenorhabditis elegans]|uniref:Serpentine Receptor, class XA n=1 Tax=Caenorhabditis elegans TaxID=6239 RepID=Q58AA0_CAEEL|nr:Serpentine Receptor, class XA [Caenorhabditis elegans]CAI70406.3 Serpentine Receptor, class XA [Caenorhabditis elegans]|eukprot:NP_001343601.1 Serpentine Receptor, class XA [Caenorhabditis elegans]